MDYPIYSSIVNPNKLNLESIVMALWLRLDCNPNLVGTIQLCSYVDYVMFLWWIVVIDVEGDHSDFREDEGSKLIFLIQLYYMLIESHRYELNLCDLLWLNLPSNDLIEWSTHVTEHIS